MCFYVRKIRNCQIKRKNANLLYGLQNFLYNDYFVRSNEDQTTYLNKAASSSIIKNKKTSFEPLITACKREPAFPSYILMKAPCFFSHIILTGLVD